jgi:hypothetical protein
MNVRVLLTVGSDKHLINDPIRRVTEQHWLGVAEALARCYVRHSGSEPIELVLVLLNRIFRFGHDDDSGHRFFNRISDYCLCRRNLYRTPRLFRGALRSFRCCPLVGAFFPTKAFLTDFFATARLARRFAFLALARRDNFAFLRTAMICSNFRSQSYPGRNFCN